jgi:acetyltransferase-like isoleucine patch superfamily enzyme
MAVFLPMPMKLFIYRRVFGYQIGDDVRIGLCLIRVGRLYIGNHVRIGNFNRFKDIPEVRIGSFCSIGTFNHFTSSPAFTNRLPRLIVGDHCGISIGHYFDIQERFEIGDFTTIAGYGSVFITHQIDILSNQQTSKGIRIGAYCMIGSTVRFAPGAWIPDRSVVGMGTVVAKRFSDEYSLIVGNPALVVRRLDSRSKYFHRRVGFVS